MPFDRNQPHNDLPLLPPAVDLETKAILKQAISANRVLANLYQDSISGRCRHCEAANRIAVFAGAGRYRRAARTADWPREILYQ